jgi:RNA polymerase sigma-70 factor (ECF subfamily)
MNQQPASGTPAQVDVLGSPAYDVTLAFETFYAQEIRGLVALAAGLCGRAWAEDVAPEAMLVTCRRWREVGRRDHPEAFARRVCSNLAVSAFRRRLVEMRAVMRLTDRSWSRVETVPGADDEFWAAVAGLPRRQAQATALRYLYGLDVAEIAETLGISVGTAKVHLYRGRQALAGRLGVEADAAVTEEGR